MPSTYQDPEATVFVSNIEARVTEEILWELFLQAGPLRNVHIPQDRTSGKNKTFGFITYKHVCSVAFACELFNTLKLFYKPIYCKPSNTGDSSNNKTNNNTNNTTGIPNYSTPVRPNMPAMGTPISPLFVQQDRRDYDDRSRDSYNRTSHSNHGSRGDSSYSSDSPRYGNRQDGGRSNYNDDRNRGYDSGSSSGGGGRSSYNNNRSYNSQGGGGGSPLFRQSFSAMANNRYDNSYNDSQRSYDNSQRSYDNYGPMRNDPAQRHRSSRRQRPY